MSISLLLVYFYFYFFSFPQESVPGVLSTSARTSQAESRGLQVTRPRQGVTPSHPTDRKPDVSKYPQRTDAKDTEVECSRQIECGRKPGSSNALAMAPAAPFPDQQRRAGISAQ